MRRLFYLLSGLILFIASAETVSRFDDWLHQGTPFLASPDRERDLTMYDTGIIRGRPHGLFRKWKLNEYGFRGDEITLLPRPEMKRVVLLGASEMFGLYESPGHDVAPELQTVLEKKWESRTSKQRYEVINASIAGMSVKRLTDYWKQWVSQFKPRYVLIYPSPMFYLDQEVPGKFRPQTAEEMTRPSPRSRFLERAKDLYHRLPWFLKAIREWWAIRSATRGKEESWFFKSVPNERLKVFESDLEELLVAIRNSGVTPILITHANRKNEAEPMRMFFPRATAETILQFEDAANDSMRKIAAKDRVELIDLATKVSGAPGFFADLVHYTDPGSKAAAEFIASKFIEIDQGEIH